MKVTELILEEIYQELDIGCDCYFNLKTSEIIGIPNFDDMLSEDEFQEAFKDDLEKIEQQKENLIKIEVPNGMEAFKIMENFVSFMPDNEFKTELESVLVNRKPFRHFKYAIDNSDYRNDWFIFKKNEYKKIVEAQLNVALKNT